MPAKGEVCVVVACDQMITRAAFASLIGGEPGLAVVGEACDCEGAIQKTLALSPDILLAVVPLAHVSAFDLLTHLHQAIPATSTPKLILLEEDLGRFEIFEALELGVRGIVTKQVAPVELIKCVHCVAAGEYWVHRDLLIEWIQSRHQKNHRYQLTLRERQILNEVLAGASNRKIARDCGIAEGTIRRHLTNLYRKLGVDGRLELMMYAMSHQL